MLNLADQSPLALLRFHREQQLAMHQRQHGHQQP